MVERKKEYSDRSAGNCVQNRVHIERAGEDMELGSPAQGAGQQVGLYSVRIGYKYGNSGRMDD
jgi:hypothetical protein